MRYVPQYVFGFSLDTLFVTNMQNIVASDATLFRLTFLTKNQYLLVDLKGWRDGLVWNPCLSTH